MVTVYVTNLSCDFQRLLACAQRFISSESRYKGSHFFGYLQYLEATKKYL